jgi:hypothetical protein
MSEGYPVVAVRADGDDVAAWLARRGIPAEVVAGPDGWVSADGLTSDDLDALTELTRDLGATAIVFDTEGDQLVVDVLGTDPALGSAPDDSHALAIASGRPELAGKVAGILGDPGIGLTVRHRRLLELLGLPSALPRSGAARAEATGAPLEPAGPAGPGRDAAPIASGGGAVVLPGWLTGIVLWTGVVGIVAALVAAVRADTSRGLLVAGLAGLAAAACLVLGMVGRATRR